METSGSVLQSDLPLEAKLQRARKELLDLSARNRLLNVPRSSKSAKTIEVVDERSAEVFRLLVKEGKAFTFQAGGAIPEADNRAGDEKEAEVQLHSTVVYRPLGRPFYCYGNRTLQMRKARLGSAVHFVGNFDTQYK